MCGMLTRFFKGFKSEKENRDFLLASFKYLTELNFCSLWSFISVDSRWKTLISIRNLEKLFEDLKIHCFVIQIVLETKL